VNANNLTIFTRTWIPKNKEIKGRVFIVHGYGEHSGRYQWVAGKLNSDGYEVYSLDHQGHGHSDGDRVYVESFLEYANDFKHFVEKILSESSSKVPNFLLGHSLGGAISLGILHNNKNFKAACLSAPAVVIDPEIAKPHLVAIAGVLSALVPKLAVPGEKVEAHKVSRDPATIKEYREGDEMIYHGFVKARFGNELLENIKWIEKEVLPVLTTPLQILHGTEDRITKIEGSYLVHKETTQLSDKKLITYDGLYHELLHEPEKETVYGDIVSWFNNHL